MITCKRCCGSLVYRKVHCTQFCGLGGDRRVGSALLRGIMNSSCSKGRFGASFRRVDNASCMCGEYFHLQLSAVFDWRCACRCWKYIATRHWYCKQPKLMKCDIHSIFYQVKKILKTKWKYSFSTHSPTKFLFWKTTRNDVFIMFHSLSRHVYTFKYAPNIHITVLYNYQKTTIHCSSCCFHKISLWSEVDKCIPSGTCAKI